MADLVFTPTVVRNLRALEAAVDCSPAILVEGITGTGKTALIAHLARLRDQDLVTVNIDDSFDAKDLLGNYICGDTPGTYVLQAGPLATAVRAGRWIVIEDIDLASFDLLSVLISLIDTGNLTVQDREIPVRPGFRLFATQALGSSTTATMNRTKVLSSFNKWGHVVIYSLSLAEMAAVVAVQNPAIPRRFVSHFLNSLNELAATQLRFRLALRDVLKWGRRVARAMPRMHFNETGYIPNTTRVALFEETVDSFCSCLPPQEYHALAAGFAGKLEVSSDALVYFLTLRKPQFRLTDGQVEVGRAVLPRLAASRPAGTLFAPTRTCLTLMESIMVAVGGGEALLLTGETGIGKTFVIQSVATMVGATMNVLNLNQQSGSSDFMGGFRPLDIQLLARPLLHRWRQLFEQVFSLAKNEAVLTSAETFCSDRRWALLVELWQSSAATALKKLQKPPPDGEEPEGKVPKRLKKKKKVKGSEGKVAEWLAFQEAVAEFDRKQQAAASSFIFQFFEGLLVQAWRQGSWLLLDEINLAGSSTLERLSAALEMQRGTLYLSERGDTEPIPMHPNFRLFACMNPPTDVGKKDLPPALRSRFTEVYVPDQLDRTDVAIVVQHYLANLTASPPVDDVVEFYIQCVKASATQLTDGNPSNPKPHYTLRTLSAALNFTRLAIGVYGFHAALQEGIRMAFGTQIARKYHPVLEGLIRKHIVKNPQAQPIAVPKAPGPNFIAFEHIWLEKGPLEATVNTKYILTPSVKVHLTNLARIVMAKRPVLLQGPTSSGKTSMVEYLAQRTGHRFVRINNHHNTDLQEYFGTYISDKRGKLYFQEGILVEACRNGYWVVLDELNLAPSEILEALNRLLDDNRELVIPETQAVIKPHPHFHLFATQNPPMLYGGRKVLSRAFRNRFVELQVDDIPHEELHAILEERYRLPKSWVSKMIRVMVHLQVLRQNSQLFAGKHGFITPRDLFKWASRGLGFIEDLAHHGFMLLGERCRRPEERAVVRQTLEKECGVVIDEARLYDCFANPTLKPLLDRMAAVKDDSSLNALVWTHSLKRLFSLVGWCMHFDEPFVLVGDTGGGKTTICQLYAALTGQQLSIVNCHQHSESSDFLGSLRPASAELAAQGKLFAWADGPLVTAMKQGYHFMLDEVNLAEDSVLERLNSVFESGRTLTLPEKGSRKVQELTAHPAFRVMATMNPGGDFGKKELSPALRNRLTEIYVPSSMGSPEDLRVILETKLGARPEFLPVLLDFIAFFMQSESKGKRPLSVRDVVGWIEFIDRGAAVGLSPAQAVVQGCDTVILGGVGIGTGMAPEAAAALRQDCLGHLCRLLAGAGHPITEAEAQRYFWEVSTSPAPTLPEELRRHYSFECETTKLNLSKIVRALALPKPLLLEGSPGVGKTTLVEALGAAYGKAVVRINLSEQTDVVDLVGSFLPDHSDPDGPPRFAWSEGLLLQALERGQWVILDELNLASQSVLEGLNSILDHRQELFVPETGRRVRPAPGFRIFGCQNPLSQGGGRKGLPRSFLNRFARVYVEPFTDADLYSVVTTVHPALPRPVAQRMVTFNALLHQRVMVERRFGAKGAPFEFNLRDLFRWCDLLQRQQAGRGRPLNPAEFADVLHLQRMRDEADRVEVQQCYAEVFRCPLPVDSRPLLFATGPGTLRINGFDVPAGATASSVGDAEKRPLLVLPGQMRSLAALLRCVDMNMMAILVGPSGSGKSSLVELAARLTGNTLRRMPMTAGCDTVELLGGFEQLEGTRGAFGWRDSVLVQALEAGDWLVIENVNFCNPTVLDRLNPLLEPNGRLVLNERGMVDGAIRVVAPHPAFRLFLTMNPQHGAVSRAMRNRGVELCLPELPPGSVDALTLLSARLYAHWGGSAAPAAPAAPLSRGLGVPVLRRLQEWHCTYVEVFHRSRDGPVAAAAHPLHRAHLMATAIPAPGLQQLLAVLERVAGLLDRPAAAAAEPAAALAEDEPENDTSTAATQWTAVSYVNPALNRLPAGLDPGLAPQLSSEETQRFQQALVQAVDDVYVRNRLLTADQQRHAWLLFDLVFGPLEESPEVPHRHLPPAFAFPPSVELLAEGVLLGQRPEESLVRALTLRRTALAAALCRDAGLALPMVSTSQPSLSLNDALRWALDYVLYTAALDPCAGPDDAYLAARARQLGTVAAPAAPPALQRALAMVDCLQREGAARLALAEVRAAWASGAPRPNSFVRWRLYLDSLPGGPLDLSSALPAAPTARERERWRELGPVVAAAQPLVPAVLQGRADADVRPIRRVVEDLVRVLATLPPLPREGKGKQALRGTGALSHLFGEATDDRIETQFLIHWRFLAKAVAHAAPLFPDPVAPLRSACDALDALVRRHFGIVQAAKAVLWKAHRPPAATAAGDVPELAGLPSALQAQGPPAEEPPPAPQAEDAEGDVPMPDAEPEPPVTPEALLRPLFALQSRAEELALLGELTRLASHPHPGPTDKLLRRLDACTAFDATHRLQTSIGAWTYGRLLAAAGGPPGGVPAALPPLLHAAWLNWHERAWGDATDGPTGSAALGGSALQGGVVGKLSGLFHGLEGAAAADCLAPAVASGAVPPPPIEDKLRSLLRYLATYRTPDVCHNDCAYLLAAWLLTLRPFAAADLALLPLATQLCDAVLAGPLGPASELRADLAAAMQQCPDARWQHTLHTHALPLLDVLLAVGAAPASAPLLCHALRGRAWAFLGEWRLLLLLPPTPVDPILRSAAKLRLAMEQRAEAEQRLAVYRHADQFARGKDRAEAAPPPEAVPLIETWGEDSVVLGLPHQALTIACKAVQQLAGSPVQRYTPPGATRSTFAQLFRDLHAFAATHVGPGTAQAVAAGLLQAFPGGTVGAPPLSATQKRRRKEREGRALKRRKSTAGAVDGGPPAEAEAEAEAAEPSPQEAQAHDLRVEEERTWQDSAGRVVGQLLATYSGFEDVVLPTTAAIHQTRHGLRQLAAAQHAYRLTAARRQGTVQARAGAGLAAVAEALPFLLGYPFSPTAAAPGALDCALRLLPASPADLQESQLGDLNLLTTVLTAVLLRLHHSLALHRYRAAGDVLRSVRRVFLAYARLWTCVTEKAEALHAAAEETYKYKMRVIRFEDDDDAALRRLRELFPSYRDSFEKFGGDQEADEDAKEDAPPPPPEVRADSAFEARLLAFRGKLLGQLEHVFAVYHAVYARVHARHLLGRVVEAGTLQLAFSPDATKGVTSHVHYRPLLTDAVTHLAGDAAAHVVDRRKAAFEAGFLAGRVISGGLERGHAIAMEKAESTGPVGPGLALLLPSDAATEERLLPAFVLGAVELHRVLASPEVRSNSIEERVQAAFNVYHEGDASEMKWALPRVQRVEQRVMQLLQEWPDHSVLNYMRRTCRSLLRLPLAQTPLMKALTGVELLLRACHEWDRNAHKGVAMKEGLQELTEVVLRWRRMELLCWPHIFTAKQQEWDAKARRWWYDFYSLVHVASFQGNQAGDGLVKQVFELANEFCTRCNFGEFPGRMAVLAALVSELAVQSGVEGGEGDAAGLDPATRTALLHVLLNTYHYYEQYRPVINAAVEAELRPIRQDLADFIKIHRWDGATYYQLKDTTKKSHRMLNKAMKKYDEVMVRSVKEALKQEQERQLGSAAAAEAADVVKRKKAGKKRKRPEEAGTADGAGDLATLRDVTLEIEGEQAAAARPAGTGLGSLTEANASALDELVVHIISRATELQHTTKSKNTKERAVKNLLTRLADLGVERPPAEALAVTGTWLAVFQNPHPTLLAHAADATSFRAADAYFYRCFSYLQVMRDAAPAAHEDLNRNQVALALALCEGLFYTLVRQREEAASLHAACRALGAAAATVRRLQAAARAGPAAGPILYPASPAAAFVARLRGYVVEVGELAAQCLHLMRGVEAVCGADPPSPAERLADVNATLGLLLTDVDRLLSDVADTTADGLGPAAVLPGSDVRAAAALLPRLGDAVAALRQCLDHPAVPPGLRRACDALPTPAELVAEYERLAAADVPRRTVAAALQAVEQWAGRCGEALTAAERGPADEEWVRTTGDALRRYVAALLAADPAGQGAALGRCLAPGLACKPATAAAVAAQCEALLGQLAGLQARAEALLLSYGGFHRSLARLLVVVSRIFCNLFAKGYCGSKEGEEEGEGQGEDRMEAGTGMDQGDSTGAKDVGEQMQYEEQVLSKEDQEKQEENKPEKKEEKGEDEDAGVELENDFEGEKENEPKPDDEDRMNEPEDEEPDDEMGEVDSENESVQGRQADKDKDDKRQTNRMDDKIEDIPEDDFKDEDQEVENNEEEDEEEEGGNKAEVPLAEKDQPHGEMPQTDELNLEPDNTMEEEQEDGSSASEGEQEDEAAGPQDGEQNEDDKGGEEEDKGEADEMEDGKEEDDEKEEKQDEAEGEQEGGDDKKDEMEEDGEGEKEKETEVEAPGEEEEKEKDGEDPKDDPANRKDRDTNTMHDTQTLDDGQEGDDQVEASQQAMKDSGADQDAQREVQQSETGQSWRHTKKAQSDSSRKDADHNRKPPDQQPLKDVRQQMQDWRSRLQKLQATVEPQSKEKEEDVPADKGDEEKGDDEGVFEYVQPDEDKPLEDSKLGMGPTDERLPETFMDREEKPEEQKRKEELGRPEEPKKEEKEEEMVDDHGELVAGKGRKKRLGEDKEDEAEEDETVEPEPEEAPVPESEEDRIKRGWELWAEYESQTATLAAQLCEQLRLILEPTLTDRLEGDFKTGKRINMKKVIPYIASGFKKDKIWLRRTKPSKRQYQVMLVVDDSQSMTSNQAGTMSCMALTLLSKALSQLEVGELSVAAFGKELSVLHPLGQPWTTEQGAEVLARFQFRQTETNIRVMLSQTLDYLDEERGRVMADVRFGGHQLLQIVIIVSDGHIVEDREVVRRHVTRAQKNWQLLVFVVLDAPKAPKDAEQPAVPRTASIMEMQVVKFTAAGKMMTEPFMADFPFPFYLVVQDIQALPDILSDSLRQWFEMLSAAL